MKCKIIEVGGDMMACSGIENPVQMRRRRGRSVGPSVPHSSASVGGNTWQCGQEDHSTGILVVGNCCCVVGTTEFFIGVTLWTTEEASIASGVRRSRIGLEAIVVGLWKRAVVTRTTIRILA